MSFLGAVPDVVAGRLVCPCDPQSCIDRSLVLLVGLTMPDRSVGEGSDKTAPWSSRLGIGYGVNSPTSQKNALLQKRQDAYQETLRPGELTNLSWHEGQ